MIPIFSMRTKHHVVFWNFRLNALIPFPTQFMIKSHQMRLEVHTIYTYIDPTSPSLTPLITQKWSVQNACYAWYRFARQMPPLFPLLFPRLHSYSYMCLFLCSYHQIFNS
jgi:hypothetical protein